MKSLRILSTVFTVILTIFITGCGHTNNLAKYDLNHKSVLFRTFVTGSASSYAAISGPNSKPNVIIDIAAAIGSGIVSDQARKKLERAANPDSMASNISLGMKQSTLDYLNLRPVDSVSDSPDFIVETELTGYELISSSIGISVKVSGKSRMIDRATGGIVWENSESHTVPLSQTWVSAFGGRAATSGASVFNAVQLLNLSEEELRKVFREASVVAGREIGETLREDVADAHKK